MTENGDGPRRHDEPLVPPKDSSLIFDNHPEFFETFDRESNQKKKEAQGIINGIKNYPDLIAKIQDKTKPFRVLLVGPAGGKVEIPVLSYITGLRGGQENIAIQGVDPAVQSNAQFISNLHASGLDDLDVAWHNGNFESFSSSDPYDLVLAVQAFQYIGEWLQDSRSVTENNSLSKMKDLAGDKGVAAIVIQSAEGDVNVVRNMSHITQTVTGKGKSHEPSSEDIAARMWAIGASGKYSRVNWVLNISSLFPRHQGNFLPDEDAADFFEPDETGKQLLSFLEREVWEETSEEYRNMFRNNFIRNYAPSMTIDTPKGKVWEGIDDYLWLTNLQPQSDVDLHDTLYLIPGDQGKDIRRARGLPELSDAA